jgi:hypothetical protein
LILRAGDIVEVRSGPEILETLDANGTLENLPFMPEMLEYIGRRYVVASRVERACDTIRGSGTRRIPNAVILEDLRCDGSGHDGCGARCRIYWKEAWLRKVGERGGARPESAERSAELEALVRRATKIPTSDGSTIYRSQATELLRASVPVSRWSLVSLRHEVACGNVEPSRFVRVMAFAVATQTGKAARRSALALAARAARKLGLRQPAPRVPSEPTQTREKAPPPQGLQPGQLVQIKPRAEIVRQLDGSNKTRGLYFDMPEMGPYCEREATVLARVERFIDEPTGRMVELKSDCYILDGVVCSGERSARRWFCPRAIYPWWRESWLSTAPDAGPVSGSYPEAGSIDGTA